LESGIEDGQQAELGSHRQSAHLLEFHGVVCATFAVRRYWKWNVLHAVSASPGGQFLGRNSQKINGT